MLKIVVVSNELPLHRIPFFRRLAQRPGLDLLAIFRTAGALPGDDQPTSEQLPRNTPASHFVSLHGGHLHDDAAVLRTLRAFAPASHVDLRPGAPLTHLVGQQLLFLVEQYAKKGRHVDVVLSRINIGFNLGHAIWHSGTLAAAKQAALLGMRGIALSAPASADPDFAPYAPWVRRVLEVVLPLTELKLVSINLPRDPRGMVWTHASIRQYDGHMVAATDPANRPIYWFTVTPLTDVEEGTDRFAIAATARQLGAVDGEEPPVGREHHQLVGGLRMHPEAAAIAFAIFHIVALFDVALEGA